MISRQERDELFESYVYPDPNSGCFLFAGGGKNNAYGLFWDGRIMAKAHRYAWERALGPIPQGLHVCHKCDTPCCANVDHLFLGTQEDNNLDKARKGRGRKGGSGLPCGVVANSGRFEARYYSSGKTIYLGLFGTIEEAAAVAAAAKAARHNQSTERRAS